uniref:Uncharacterized protein n=1 Tax=Phlebotomus papatasi TaxID=29031 RepID=A0A1B0GM11_PHLPP
MFYVLHRINNKPDAVLPLRTDGCINGTITDFVGNSSDDSKENFWLFEISFIYYGLIGTLSGICIGYLTSLLTGGNTVEDQRLLAPFLRRKVLSEEEITLQREPINVCD